jgi:ABC-type lipoprotein release transport system permease subunit
MRAVGVRSRLFAMALEGVTIGMLGCSGSRHGVALGTFWVEVQFPCLGWQLDLHFPSTFALVASGVTILLGLVASIVPAARAAYLPVPQTLRNE